MSSSSLQGVYIENYGTINQQYLELGSGLNVLYGLNGAGKSQILDCVTRTISNDDVFMERQPVLRENPLLASLVMLPGSGSVFHENSRTWSGFSLPSSENILEALLGSTQIGRRAESGGTVIPRPYDSSESEKIIRETISDGLLVLVPVPSRNAFQVIYSVKQNSESNIFQVTWRNLREAITRGDIEWKAKYDVDDITDEYKYKIWPEALKGLEDSPVYNAFTIRGSLKDRNPVTYGSGWGKSLDDEGLLHWPMPFVPIASLGFINAMPAILINESKNESLEHLSWWHTSKMRSLYRYAGNWDDFHAKFSADLSNSVNHLLQSFMFGLPKPNFDVGSPDRWMNSGPPSWKFSINDHEVDFENLSNVQRRFCKLAIRIHQNLEQMIYDNDLKIQASEKNIDAENIPDPDEFPILLVVDEPESGLNRTGEDFLAQGFADLAGKHVNSLVASHAPSFLNVGNAKINLIEISNTGTTIKPLIMPDIRNLSSLGLRPGDLLQMYKVFWLVEGEHELAVFEELFRFELEKYKIKVLPLRGVKSLASVADSSMLFEYTNAKILVTVDNVQNTKLNSAWTSAKEMVKNKQPVNRVVGELQRNLNEKTYEIKNIKELMTSSLISGNWERLEFSSLTKKDLIEYFAPEAFNLNSDWATLRSQHDLQKNRYSDFKEFLRVNNGAHISTNALVEACKTLDAIDPDWTECLRAAIKLSESPQ